MFSSSQEKLISHFEKAAKSSSLRQCYIIKGEKGLGKSFALEKIAKTIICHENSACGVCNACMSYSSMANPDVVTVSNGDKAVIEVFKIRDMIKEVYIKPILGKYKLFIIENAHLMGDSPQNALLKVIEEPPPYAIFLLVCDNVNTILPTILSRSHVLTLGMWQTQELSSVFQLGDAEHFAYAYCMGNIGVLKDICADEEFKLLRTKVIDSFVKLVEKDDIAFYDAIELWNLNKERKDDLLNILIMFLRDVMLTKSGMTENITNTDKINQIKALSGKITFKKGYEMLSCANDAPRLMGKYGNFSMAVQTMMTKLKKLSS